MELIVKFTWTPNLGRIDIGRFTRRLVARYRERQRMRRDMRTLSHLSDRMLQDIGVERYELPRPGIAPWPGL